jgi:hypothetical protein
MPMPSVAQAQPATKPDLLLPNPTLCRVKKYGIVDFFECLVDQPGGCRHALGFGNGFLCRNPKREEISARTQVNAAGG